MHWGKDWCRRAIMDFTGRNVNLYGFHLAGKMPPRRMDRLTTSHYRTAVATLTVLAALVMWCMPAWTVDDAYISYRYAQNWVEQGQLSWNPGQAPVEGFTGYALVFLAAACLRMGIPLEAGLDLVGMGAALAMLPVLGVLLPRLGVQRAWALVVLASLALNPTFYLHAGSGLETTWFALLVATWLLWLTMDAQDGMHRIGLLGWLLCAALVLTRPEGLVLAGLSAGRFGWMVWRSRNWPALLWPAMFAIALAIALACRYQHFGAWLPNTYWAKHYHGLLNAESVKEALRFGGLYVLLPILAGGLLCYMDPEAVRARWQAGPGAAMRTRARTTLALGGLAAGVILLSYFRAHLYMNYAGRFFFPLLPVGLVVAGIVLQAGWDNYRQFGAGQALRKGMARWTLIVLLGAQIVVLGYKWQAESGWLRRYQAIVTQELVPLGKDLRLRFPEGGRLVCYMDAGAIPFFSRMQSTDFGRLNDAYLPRQEQGSMACIDYFFAQNADAVIFTSHAREAVRYTDEAAAILDDPRFSAYQLVKVYAAEGVDDYFQHLFIQKIVP